MSQTKTQLVASPLNLNGADLTFPSTQGSANQYLRNSATPGTLEFAALASSDMPSGSVVQVLQKEVTGSADYTTATPTLRIEQSITLKDASNSVLMIYTAGDSYSFGSTGTHGASDFYLNGSLLKGFTRELGRGVNGIWYVIAGQYKHSPGSVGPHLYQVYHWNKSATGTFRVGDTGMGSYLTLLEIQS